jgi:hypothetical protein
MCKRTDSLVGSQLRHSIPGVPGSSPSQTAYFSHPLTFDSQQLVRKQCEIDLGVSYPHLFKGDCDGWYKTPSPISQCSRTNFNKAVEYVMVLNCSLFREMMRKQPYTI